VRPDGSQLIYSTYLGERNDPVTPFAVPANVLSDMTVDAAGNAALADRMNTKSPP